MIWGGSSTDKNWQWGVWRRAAPPQLFMIGSGNRKVWAWVWVWDCMMRTKVTVKHGNTLKMLIDMQGIEGRGVSAGVGAYSKSFTAFFRDNETVGHDSELLFHCYQCRFSAFLCDQYVLYIQLKGYEGDAANKSVRSDTYWHVLVVLTYYIELG